MEIYTINASLNTLLKPSRMGSVGYVSHMCETRFPYNICADKCERRKKNCGNSDIYGSNTKTYIKEFEYEVTEWM